jgi:hypothetical protein
MPATGLLHSELKFHRFEEFPSSIDQGMNVTFAPARSLDQL